LSSRGSRSSWQHKQGLRLRDNSKRRPRGSGNVKDRSWSFKGKKKRKRDYEWRKKRSLREKSKKKKRHARQLRKMSASASSKRNFNSRGRERQRTNCVSRRRLEGVHPPQLALCHNSQEVPERLKLDQPPLGPSLPSVTSHSFQGGQTLRVVFKMLTLSQLQQALQPLEKFAGPISCQPDPRLVLVKFGGLQGHLRN